MSSDTGSEAYPEPVNPGTPVPAPTKPDTGSEADPTDTSAS